MDRRLRVAAALLLLLLMHQPASAQVNSKSPLEQADKYALDGNLTQARAAYERAIAAGEPVDRDYMRSRNLGLSYLNGLPQDLSSAAKWFNIAVQLRPGAEDTRLFLAQALSWSGKYDDAAQQYRLLLSAHPASVEYLLGLANVLHWKGETAAAFGILERFLEQYPSQIEVRLHYARLLGYEKRYTDARNQYQAVLQNDRDNLGAQVGLAKLTAWQSQLDLALDLFNKILQRHPGYYDAVVGKAFTLLWLGQRDQARELFIAARNRDPKDKEVLAALKSLRAAAAPVARPRPPVVAARSKAAIKPAPVAAPVETAIVASPANAVPAPVEAPQPAPVDPVTEFLAAAEGDSARGNYTLAVHHLHQALELQPDSIPIRLQIARVLSWSKNYDDAVAEYDEVLSSASSNLSAHTEKARVLSWSRKFDASLDEYQLALKLAEADPQPAVAARDIRQEYARVLSWAKRYDESLAQYQLLLPDASQLTLEQLPVVIEQARVLGWSRRYPESTAAYDRALHLDPQNFEARLGKAQTAFWSGHLPESASQLRALLLVKPQDPDLRFTLASVEHGLGNNARSLRLLQTAPPVGEAAELRTTIHRELRPVLRFRYGFEDDREIVPSSLDSTTKVLRYSSAIEFSILPDVRMEIANTVTNGVTSNALLGKHRGDATAIETIARIDFRPLPWLRLIAGAGAGETGGSVLGQPAPINQHFVYDIHPIVVHGDFRADFSVSRHIADYTPLAIHDNVMQHRYSVAASYNWRHRVPIAADLWYAHYTVDSPQPGLARYFQANGTGGSASVAPVVLRREHLVVNAGVRFDGFTFDDHTAAILTPASGIGSAGFFTPRIYQRIAGTGRAAWDPSPVVHLEVNGTYGPQRIFGFASLNPPPPTFGQTGSFGAQATLNFGHLHPTLAYDYFSTATPAAPAQQTGQYRSNVFTLGLTYRF